MVLIVARESLPPLLRQMVLLRRHRMGQQLLATVQLLQLRAVQQRQLVAEGPPQPLVALRPQPLVARQRLLQGERQHQVVFDDFALNNLHRTDFDT